MGKKDKATSAIEQEINEIREEARDDFDLSRRLAGRAKREKPITVYSDAEAGEQLGYAVDEEELGGIKTGRRAREGVLGKLDALKEEGKQLAKQIEANAEMELESDPADLERAQAIPAEMAKLQAKADKLRERLKETSFTFTLQSLPEVIEKAVKRETRDALKIEGKGIPGARQEEYEREYEAQMLAKSTVRWTDHETGDQHEGLTIERARSFRRFLPRGQFDRLDRAIANLSFARVIANSATDDADF